MSLVHDMWIRMVARFPRTTTFVRSLSPAYRRHAREKHGLSTEAVFTRIYEANEWKSDESRSGLGSTLAATQTLRSQLPELLKKLQATSMLDAPCGDFNWMRTCDLPLRSYIGADIVAPLIDDLNRKYGSPTRSFMKLDVTTQPLPEADIFFCRDLLLHLSLEKIRAVLDNFARSRCKWLVVSTYLDVRANAPGFTGGVRLINLELPPFNLPKPRTYLSDPGETPFDRRMGVWSREEVQNT
jgi:hypothetical protein